MGRWAPSSFTEDEYFHMVGSAATRYRFASFVDPGESPVVLWRHDVDLSVQRARRLAEIEHGIGVRSTFFFLFHSEFYNLLERPVLDRAREIVELGHWAGLHFDAGFYAPSDEATLRTAMRRERHLLEDLLQVPVEAVSFHNPTANGGLPFTADDLEGMVNAYGSSFSSSFTYVSDSNGLWKAEPAPAVLDPERHPRVHVLTHPGWWTPEPLSPRDRIERCLQGRARASAERYDALLHEMGRPNIR